MSDINYQRETGNFIVAMITSVPHNTLYDYKINDWKKANLISPSWIRMKLATIDPQLVRYQPGRMTDNDMEEVNKRVRLVLNV